MRCRAGLRRRGVPRLQRQRWAGGLPAVSRARARKDAASPRDKGRGWPRSGAKRTAGARGGPSSPIWGHSGYFGVTRPTGLSDIPGEVRRMSDPDVGAVTPKPRPTTWRNVSSALARGAGARLPATHAPPSAPLLVVGQRAERATPARDRPTRPTEETAGQREQPRTSETAAGRGLGRQTDPGPASAQSLYPGHGTRRCR